MYTHYNIWSVLITTQMALKDGKNVACRIVEILFLEYYEIINKV